MAQDNPTWGPERIANELFLTLGLWVSPRTVASREVLHGIFEALDKRTGRRE
jgi:hypothetical protein